MRLVALLLICLAVPALSPLSAQKSTTDLLSTRHTNAIPAPIPLVESPKDATIVQFVSRLLQGQHYLQMPINDDVSSKFLDRYLDSLDNLHIYFLQSDVQEWEKYRYRLDDLTVNEGDTTLARLVFSRFRQRLNQQYEYVLELLKENKFDFTGNDRYTVDRKKLPRPRDLDEAKKLWRDRLRHEYLIEKLNKVESSDIVTNLTRRYTRVLRLINEYDNDDALQIYLTALARVYDPHSDYMGKSEFDNFSIGMKLSLYGIGALLESDDGICKIRSLTDGGPAQRSKQLKPGDKIIAVAQSNAPPMDVMDIKLSKVVEQIRGPKGTEVRLTIIPADAPNSTVRKVVALIRDEIKLEDSAAKAKIIELPAGKDPSGQERLTRLGIIDLPSFYSGAGVDGRRPGAEQKSTTTDVARLLRKLMQEKVTGVILDLRHNGGGLLDEAVSLTGLFIKEGPVVQVRNFDGTTSEDKDPDSSVLYDGPLVVLTSRYSASASEILAGALQDYGRALIVGDSSTHGKGTVQSLLELKPIMRRSGVFMTNDPGALKVTIRKFYRASGASTQLKGVTPDIVLPSVNNHIEVGEASLDNPLEWDTIPSAQYARLGRVEPHLAELKKRSNQRIAADPDFVWVAQEIERFKKLQAEKSVSLNEAVRLKEKKENDDRAKARKKELAARPEPAGKVYDITLKLAEQPGLPPPTVRTNQTAASTTNGAPIVISGATNKATAAKPVAKATKPKAKSDEDDDDLDAPPVDIMLDEAKRVLIDYASLLKNGNSVAQSRPGQNLGNTVSPKDGTVTR
jgi:carboxyl-terminal processing protease